ncbi:MAG TPA: hypothetical protein VGY13_07845 [Solirubrobacteraceae bacterium]|nr:hypothetical protein [Solirubrobacteraceae bacterium]
MRVARLDAEDLPQASVAPRTAAGVRVGTQGPLLACGAPHGQIAIAALAQASAPSAAPPAAAPAARPAPATTTTLIQGPAGGPFAPLAGSAGGAPGAGSPGAGLPAGRASPAALTTAYLGDLGLATPAQGDRRPGRPAAAVRVRVERFYAHAFSREALAGDAREGPVGTLALALDYRSEALVAWTQHGAIFAQLLPARGRPGPIQRLARGAPDAHLSALLSDDYRGIVAWSTQSDGHTAVYLDRSAVGVRFAAAQQIEGYADPDAVPAPAASPSLVRLSSEGVVMAWAGVSAGHWVVRAAPVEETGMGAASTLAAPGADALLADLVAGPDDEAIALWSEPAPGPSAEPDLDRQALFAARGRGAYPGIVAFGEPEAVAPAGPVADARLAVDPASGRALASWLGPSDSVEYSLRGGEPGR